MLNCVFNSDQWFQTTGCLQKSLKNMQVRGRSMISGKGVHMFKDVGDRFGFFFFIFLKLSMKMK